MFFTGTSYKEHKVTYTAHLMSCVKFSFYIYISSYLFIRIWFLKNKNKLDHSFNIFLLGSHKNFLYSKFQSLGNRATSLEKTVAICSKYKIAYFPLANLQGIWVEGKDTPLWRDQAPNLDNCQNLLWVEENFLKIIYLSHPSGNRLKIFALLTVFYLWPFVGVHPYSGSPH